MSLAREKLLALILALGITGMGAVAVAAAPQSAHTPHTAVSESCSESGDSSTDCNDDSDGNRDENDDANEQGDNETADDSATPGADQPDAQCAANATPETGDAGAANADLSGTPEADDQHEADETSGTPSADDHNQAEDQDDCDEPEGAPGTLDEVGALVSHAAVTLDQAIATAQKAATGTLGQVDLIQENGAFYYSVDIGNQEVHVDATTGQVIEVVPAG